MNELALAGNRVFSHIIEDDNIFPYKLRVAGYESFDDLYTKSSENNLFKTPVNFSEPAAGPGYQFSTSVADEFKQYVCGLINAQLNVDLEIKEAWYLHQTDDSWIDNPVHVHMTADWIAVVYLDVKQGDAIEFYDAGGNMERYEPQFGEILFFPGSALHKPAPNVSQKRLTINMELGRKALSEQELQTIEHRMSTCNACPELNKATLVCSQCSCYIPMKVMRSDQSCPISKW